MAKHEVILPAMGEGIIEATITKWLINEGNLIKEDDPIVEIATDKVDSEIPAPISGILSKILYKEGEIPKVGEVIAIIENDKPTTNTKEPSIYTPDVRDTDISISSSDEQVVAASPLLNTDNETPNNFTVSKLGDNEYYSPFIKNLAKQRKILFDELKQITGTGKNNRITKDDLNTYIKSGRPFNTKYNEELNFEIPKEKKFEPAFTYDHNQSEIIHMDRVRKLIADNMSRSKKTAPHVTSFTEADVTNMVTWREKVKKQFIKDEGVNLTYTALITEIVAKVLKEFPKINSSINGDKIIIKKDINIGIATALTDGNLIVSVIKQADKENLQGLAHKLYDLTLRARNNKLQPSEIKGSTFTITNIGQYNSITGTPIINLPEVAILAIGTIKKKPAVVPMQNGLGIGIRDIVVLSLTYDHRIIDGALGGRFLAKVATYLENFDLNKTL